jgi:hypothetical protein
LNEPASSDPFRLVSNCRNTAPQVDFAGPSHTQLTPLYTAQLLLIDLTDQRGRPYNVSA